MGHVVVNSEHELQHLHTTYTRLETMVSATFSTLDIFWHH